MLGKGSVDFETVIRQFHGLQYDGKFILQTGRSDVDNHKALCRDRLIFGHRNGRKAVA